MGAFIETCRGTYASAMWLGGMPFLNWRVATYSKDTTDARRLLAAHCQRFLDRCRIKVVIEGVPPNEGEGCVVMYNEASFIDVAVFAAVMWPNVDRAVAAELYGYLPFGRAAAQQTGIALVPRGNRAGTDKLLAQTVRTVKSGARVAWGGEGRISGIDGIGHFKIGGSLLAIKAQAPIRPVVFFGGHALMPLRSLRARPGTVTVRFGAPIPTEGLVDQDARALADRAQGIFAGMYEDMRQENTAELEPRP